MIHSWLGFHKHLITFIWSINMKNFRASVAAVILFHTSVVILILQFTLLLSVRSADQSITRVWLKGCFCPVTNVLTGSSCGSSLLHLLKWGEHPAWWRTSVDLWRTEERGREEAELSDWKTPRDHMETWRGGHTITTHLCVCCKNKYHMIDPGVSGRCWLWSEGRAAHWHSQTWDWRLFVQTHVALIWWTWIFWLETIFYWTEVSKRN